MTTEQDMLDAVKLLRALPEGSVVLAEAVKNLGIAISQAKVQISQEQDVTQKGILAGARDILVALRELLSGRSAYGMSEPALQYLAEQVPAAEESIRQAAAVSQTLQGRMITWYNAAKQGLGLGLLVTAIVWAIVALILALATGIGSLAAYKLADSRQTLAEQGIAPTGSLDFMAWGLLAVIAVGVFGASRKGS